MSSTPNLPVIGILGDGQLSWMMTEAYQALGGAVHVLGPNSDTPAHSIANVSVVGDINDYNDLIRFFPNVDVVTIENEFIDSDLLMKVAEETEVSVRPEPDRYSLIENKLAESQFFHDAGVPVADFFKVDSERDLLDEPGFLKLSKGGYDGIGTCAVENLAEAKQVWSELRVKGDVVFQHKVTFDKELSVIAVKSGDQVEFYPMVETHQDLGTCRYVTFPSGVDNDVEQLGFDLVGRIMEKLDCNGLFAFELFLKSDGTLILNESAPRPHNSGHITLDSVDCSQFENHMRAVAGLRLTKPTVLKTPALMLNLLASKAGEFDEQAIVDAIEDSELSVKLYGKGTSRPKRKMGHINLWGDDLWARARLLNETLDF